MFEFCASPADLSGTAWLACYLTTGTHVSFYASFGTVLLLLAVTAPVALFFGLAGAVAARSRIVPLALFGRGYIAIVRAIPDIIFFMFFIIALDQGIEWVTHLFVCDDLGQPVWQGNEFRVCAAAKVPPATASAFVNAAYSFALAVFTFALVYGAFVANVLFGAMRAVPRGQIEAAEAFGMSQRQILHRVIVPQMWRYALPGLSNLWMLLIKATPLLFLLGIKDAVYWARELGAAKSVARNLYPHGDLRLVYFLALLVFYLLLTWVSERVFARLVRRFAHGDDRGLGPDAAPPADAPHPPVAEPAR